MKRSHRSVRLAFPCLAFSTVTLLATVAACGRTAGSSEQQLIELASKASTRLKAQNGDSADALTKRNAEATERLLRGLIDKEREERMAADKLLSDRIDVLDSELKAFKDQVNAKFAVVDKRDLELRAEMTSNFEELRNVDKALAERIEQEATARAEAIAAVQASQQDLEANTTAKFAAVEKSFDDKLKEQKDVLTAAISTVQSELETKNKQLQASLDAKTAELASAAEANKAKIQEEVNKLQAQLDAEKARASLIEQAAAAEQARLDRTIAAMNSVREDLVGEIAKVEGELNKAKLDLKSQMATESAAHRANLEMAVRGLESQMASLGNDLKAETAALAAKQVEQDKKISTLDSRLEAEKKAREEALSALKSETENLIKTTDAKTQQELRSLISEVEQASSENVESVQRQLIDALSKQDANTRIQILGLTQQMVSVREEASKGREELEKRMLSSIENVRGELISKVADLNTALSSARSELSSQLTSGLSGLSSEFSEKLKVAEAQLSEDLRKEVAAQRLEMEGLRLSLKQSEEKWGERLSSELANVRDEAANQSAEVKAALDALDGKIANLSEEDKKIYVELENLSKYSVDAASALAKEQAILKAALDASNAEYEEKLKQADEGQRALLEAERQARADELAKLQTDLVSVKEAQDKAREDILSQMSASDDEIKKALEALDKTTFATVANLRDAISEERKHTEGKLAQVVSGIEGKLADAAAKTEEVAARVEAVNRAQEEFQAYVAKNYATKGELEALNLRVEGLEFVTKVMNADMVRANAEMKALISKEVADAKAELGDRIGKVEATVDGVKNQLGGAIKDYQAQIKKLSVKMNNSFKKVKSDMKAQDNALFAAISDSKAMQEKVNADIMASVKQQAADFEAMSQGFKRELSDKLVQIEGQIDKTNAELKAEHEAVQAQFAEVVRQEQAMKEQFANELAGLKKEIEDVAKVADQSLKMAEANAAELQVVRAGIEEQKKFVAKKFRLQQADIDKLDSTVKDMKADFNKRLNEVAAHAEELVENLGDEVKANFKKVATDIAKVKSAQKAVQAKLVNYYVETFSMPENTSPLSWNSDMEQFAALVAEDQDLVLVKKELKNGKTKVVGKGPLVSTLEAFVEARRAFLRALQPQQREDGGERIESYDKSFVPIMTQCGGNAEATFANAFGRDSFDFLADEFITGLIYGARGLKADALYLKNGQLSDGSSLHHFVMMEAARTLEGASNDPKCMSMIKSWANKTLNSNEFAAHRDRIAKDSDFQARIAEFVKATTDLRTAVDKLEKRFANDMVKGQTRIKTAFRKITNPTSRFGKNQVDDVSTSLLAKMATALSEGADATYDAIARQEEFDKMVAVQQQFVKAMQEENQQDTAEAKAIRDEAAKREAAMNKKIATLQSKLNEFDKTARKVEALENKLAGTNAALSKALDVVLSLAIRSGDPELVAATKQAGALIGYRPKEVGIVKPKVLEIQHFFASPALANGSDTCDGYRIKRGAGVKFWHSQGTMQCWVNFRRISRSRWSSAAGTIWFRVFGAAKTMRVRSHMCKGEAKNKYYCDATFKYQRGAASVVHPEDKVIGIPEQLPSTKMTGQPNEGVFDVRIPGILDPYLSSSERPSWYGETVNFQAIGSEGQGSVTKSHRIQLFSPVILDFMSVGKPMFKGVAESNVKFDLDGNGRSERTGWMAGYRDVGLLALDLNNNGQIDDGSELFGEGTVINSTGKKGKDGYTALAQYDSNRDGVIDRNDEVFSKLVVWFDRNHDGKTNSDELVSLSSTGVTKVGLNFKRMAGEDRFVNGNELRTTAKFWGPKQCGESGCNSYDVYFSTAFTVSKKD